MIEVETPNGVVEFPDTVPLPQIKAVLDASFGQKQPDLSPFERAIRDTESYLDANRDKIGRTDWANRDLPPQHRLASFILDQEASRPAQENPARYLLERAPFAGALLNAFSSRQASAAAERFTAGVPTADDLMVLEAERSRLLIEGNKGVVRRGVDLATRLPGYGLEFAAGGAPAGAATGAVSKAIGLADDAPKLARGLATLAETVANVGARTATVGLPRVLESAENQRQFRGDRQSVGKAYWNGFLDMLIENSTELMGIPLLGRTRAAEIARNAIGRIWQSRGRAAGDLSKLAKKVGFHGVIGEMVEERAGDLARGATGVEEDYGVFSAETIGQAAEQLAVEAIGFSFPAAGRAIAERMGYGDVDEADVQAAQDLIEAQALREHAIRQAAEPTEPAEPAEPDVEPPVEPIQPPVEPVQPPVEPPAAEQATEPEKEAGEAMENESLAEMGKQMGKAIAENARKGAADMLRWQKTFVSRDPDIVKVYATELDQHLSGKIRHLVHPDGRNLFIDPGAADVDAIQEKAIAQGFTVVGQPPAKPTLNRADVTPDEILSSSETMQTELATALAKQGGDPAKFPRKLFRDITGVSAAKFGKGYRELIIDTLEMAGERAAVAESADDDDSDTEFDFGAQDPKRIKKMRQEHKKRYRQSLKQEAAEIKKVYDDDVAHRNDAIANIVASIGLTPLGVRNIVRASEKRAGDPDQIRQFDIMLDHARRHYPELLQGDQSEEEALRQLLYRGVMARMTPAEARRLAAERLEKQGVEEDPPDEFFTEQMRESEREEDAVPFYPQKPIKDPNQEASLGSSSDIPAGDLGEPTQDPIFGVPLRSAMPARLDKPTERVKPASAPQIIKQLERAGRAFGSVARVRTGFMGQLKRRASGVYWPVPDTINLAMADNIYTAAHEIGHAIDANTFVKGMARGKAADKLWRAKLSARAAKELQDAGERLYAGFGVPQGGYLREGFAEYIAAYVGHPESIPKLFPEFHQWFLGKIKDTKGEKELNKARDLATRWREMGAAERAKASIVRTDSLSEAVRKAIPKRVASKLVENYIDIFEPLRVFSRDAADRAGLPALPSEMDPFVTASARRGTAPGIVKYMTEQAMIDFYGNPIGDGLEAIGALIGDRRPEFTIYLWARRTLALIGEPQRLITETDEQWQAKLDRAAKLRKSRASGLSIEDAEQIIKDLDSREFQLAAAKVYEWSRGLLNYAAQASPHFRDVINKVRRADPGDYIPLSRAFDDLDEIYRSRPYASATGSPVKRLRGSGRRIKDPFPQLLANAQRIVESAHAAAVNHQVITIAKQFPKMGDWIQKVPKDIELKWRESTSSVLKKIKRDLILVDDDGDPIPDDVIEDFSINIDVDFDRVVSFFGLRERYTGSQPVITIPNAAGETEWYYLDERLFQAMNSERPQLFNKSNVDGLVMLGKVLNKSSRLFKFGTVGIRLRFLLSNLSRDAFTYFFQTQSDRSAVHDAATYFATMGEMVWARFTGKHKTEWEDAYERLGINMAQMLAEDRRPTARAAARIFQGKTTRYLRPNNAFDLLVELIQFGERVPRVAELKNIARKHNWTPDQPITPGVFNELALGPKQVTVDFTAYGHHSGVYNQISPFFNVIFQGPRSFVRAVERDPAKVMRRGLAIMGLALWNWARIKDEEWYKQADERKYLYFTIPFRNPTNGNEELFMLPRDYGLGMIFGAMAEGLMDSWYRQDPESATTALNVWVKTSLGFSAPPLVNEALEQAANKDFYLQRPIVPKSLEDAPAPRQHTTYTTQAAKAIARIAHDSSLDKLPLGLGEVVTSPARLEHMVDGLGGPVWVDLVGVVEKTLFEDVKESDEGWNPADMVVLGALFKSGGPMGYRPKAVDEVYERWNDAIGRQRDPENPETPADRQKRLLLDDAAKAISAIIMTKQLVGSERQRRDLTQEMLDIAKAALEEHDKPGVPLRSRVQAMRRSAQARRERIERERKRP